MTGVIQTADREDYAWPTPTNWSRAEVHTYAEHIAREIGYEPGADLTEHVIPLLGGRIHFVDSWVLNQTSDASILIQGENDFDIYLSRYTGHLRDRFSIVHELGHYFLHSNQGKIRMQASRAYNRETEQRVEWEANWFAGAFLMPEVEFRQSLNEFGVQNTAARFGVSPTAAGVRMKILSIDPNKYLA